MENKSQKATVDFLMLKFYCYCKKHILQVLIEREWITFGHKFADRCGQGLTSNDISERSPIFIQWLDCVFQLIAQFPCDFQFNQIYLVKLAQHTYSNLFGSFLCNTIREFQMHCLQKTYSVSSPITPRLQGNIPNGHNP